MERKVIISSIEEAKNSSYSNEVDRALGSLARHNGLLTKVREAVMKYDQYEQTADMLSCFVEAKEIIETIVEDIDGAITDLKKK